MSAVRWFDDAISYGFISRGATQGGFAHPSTILGEGTRSLSDTEQVEFAVEQARGLPAVRVGAEMRR
jgi:cold shock CspA family protein